MVKYFTRIQFTILGLLCILTAFGQVSPPSIPKFNNTNRSNPEINLKKDGSLKISGFIGHPEEGHKAIMVADLPIEEVKKECVFFGGDSLHGFDFASSYKQAEIEGNKMYSEFKVFMFKAQKEFVKKKYHLTALPFEISRENSRNVPPSTLVSACSNMDFENGDFSNWVGASGYNQNSNAFLTAMGTAFYNTNLGIYDCADLQLISSAYGNDPIGGFPGKDPNGGNWSARLGGFYINEAIGYDGGTCTGSQWSAIYSNGEYIKQTFTVSAANALVSFDYAVILNDGGHPNGQQPYFHVYVTNSSNVVLNATCTEYYVQAPAGSPPPGFTNSGFVNSGDGSILYYQPWKSGSINLTPYMGQAVNLYFIAAGCTNGGHPGWAYIDATCGAAAITVANVNPCTGSTTTMTAPPVYGGSYSWSGPGIVGSSTGQTITVNASGTYTVIVTPPQGAACAYTLTQSVTFIPTPTAAPAAAPASLCSGSTTTLTANASNATSYNWSPGGSTASSFTVTPPTGTTVYTLTVTNGGLCAVTKTVSVTVVATPTLNITGNTNICSGTSTTLTGATANTYSWSVGSTSASISVSPSSTTTYTLTGTNGGLCAVTKTITVNVTPTPTLNITGTTTLCSGNSTVLTGATANTYSWSTGATTNTISVTPPTGTTTYTLSGTNGGLCTTTKTVSVVVTATPTLAITGNTSLCSGASTVLTGATASTYSWSTGATTNTISVTPPTGSTTYTLIGSNGACTTTKTVTVNVTATPTLSISGTTSLCSGGSTVLTGATATSYSWSTGATTNTISVTPPTGTTTYTLTGNNGGGCTATKTVSVVVTATPTLAITGNTALCNGASTVLTGATASTYSWSTGATTNTISVTPPTGSTTYTLTGSNGACTTTTTATVNVTATPTLSITGNTTLCSGQSTVLTGATATTYSWNTGATTNTITVTPPTGTTTYTLSGNNGGGCTATKTVSVNVTATPTVNISGNLNICSGQSTVLTGASAAGYTWSTGATTNTISVSPPIGTTSYTLTGANGACTASNVATVNVTATPTVTISGTTSLCSGQSTVLTGATANNYTWSTGATTNTITVTPPAGSTTYTLSGSNGGCTTTTTAVVNVTATPTVNISGNTNLCSGQSTVLTGATASNYTWSTGATTNTITVTPPTGSTSYTLTGANGACTSTTTAIINVTATPTVSISGATPICSGQSVVLSGATANTYTWSTGSAANTITVTPGASTTYTLTGANGTCTATALATVTVTPTPTVAITGAGPVCNGQSVTLNGATATSYTWNPGGANTGTISVTPGATTTYTLTGANGTCTATTTAIVTVNPLPVVTGSVVTAAPCGQSTGCINSVSVSNGTPTYNYSWNGGVTWSTNSQYCNHPAGTYVVNVSDANGCTTSGNITIPSASGPPTPQITASSTVACIGDNVVVSVPSQAGITFTWTDNTGTHTGTSYTITNIGPAGNYNVSVTATDINGCTSSSNISITVNPLPVINSTASPTVICNGQGTVLNASGATSYTWSANAGSVTTSTASVTPSTTTTYTVTGSTLGCISTQTVAVTVNPLPVITTSSSPGTICNGQPTVLTANGATTYTWSANAGSVQTSTASVNPSSTATYTVTGDNLGCTSTQTVLVNVTPLPSLTVTAAPPTICVGQSTVLTAGGATSYTWSTGATTSSTTVSPTSTTTYTLIGTQNGCTDSSTVIVSIGPPPGITANASQSTICSGQSTTLTGSGATSYTWSPGGSTTNPLVVSPTSPTTYTLTGGNGGCTSTQTISVNVNPTPTVALSASSNTVCSGTSVVLSGSGATNYTWMPGGVTTSTISVTPPTGSTTYTLTGDAVGGCTSTNTVTINVTATPTVTANASQGGTICSSQTATLTATGAPSYTWMPGNNTSGTFTVSPGTNTTYTVTGANGNCLSTQTVSVNVIQTPTLTLNTQAISICAGATTTLTASGATNYTWLPSGATTPTITDTPGSTTTYTVIGDNQGCIDTKNVVVTVNPLPVLSTVGNQVVCSGSGVNGITYNVNPTTSTINWTNTNANIGITASGSGNISGYTAPTLTATQTGVITATPTDNGTGCPGASQSYTITINPSPTVAGGLADSARCGILNGSVSGFTVTGGTPIYHYQWYNGSTPIPGDTMPTLSNAGGGSYSVSITDANGCVALGGITSFTIGASIAVVASFTPSVFQGQAPLNVTFTNGSVGASAYNWNLGNGSSTQMNPSATYNAQGTYTVLLTSSNGGCIDTATAVIIVDVETSIIIPNIFSPNGDGLNDVFIIMSTGMKTLNCDIFNRWGQLVYTLNAPDQSWDGKLNNGNEASEGTYYIILNAVGFDKKPYNYKGPLTLVK